MRIYLFLILFFYFSFIFLSFFFFLVFANRKSNGRLLPGIFLTFWTQKNQKFALLQNQKSTRLDKIMRCGRK